MSGSVDLTSAIYSWYLKAAIKPNHDAALLTALSLVGGIAGRAYNINGAGLSDYWCYLHTSGGGKGGIAKNANKLINKVAETVPTVLDFKGAGAIASGPAVYSMLNDRPQPIAICYLDEFGHDLEEFGYKNNANGKAKEKALMQIWPLSGAGETLDEKVHSDKAKNTNRLISPTLTIVGTTTPAKFDRVVSEDFVSDGLGARFTVIRNDGDIPPDNDDHLSHYNNPPFALVQGLADLAASCLTHMHQCGVVEIAMTGEARARFKDHSEEVRRKLNDKAEGTSRELWNRAAQKALKVAGILAVGQNYIAPCVTDDQAAWAIGYINHHTERLVAKFRNGEVGEDGGNQVKQRDEVIRVLREYLTRPWPESKKYHGYEEMHNKGIITFAHIQQRLQPTAAFRNDRQGAQRALAETVKFLLDSDILREMPRQEMVNQFGKHPRAFVASDPALILKGFSA